MPALELNLDMQDKEFRHFYLSAQIRELLAQQIRATREQRGWTQGELAEKAGMAQERISLLEDPDYAGVTLKTLKRVAEAFDVALIVRYAPFSELLRWVENFNPEQLLPLTPEERREIAKSLLHEHTRITCSLRLRRVR